MLSILLCIFIFYVIWEHTRTHTWDMMIANKLRINNSNNNHGRTFNNNLTETQILLARYKLDRKGEREIQTERRTTT